MIGNNVVIGAGSVVSGIVESNSVYAGNPARKIMSLEEYKGRRERRQVDEARAFFREYYMAHGSVPKEEKFHEYFFVFTNNTDDLNPVFDKKLELCGNYEESKRALQEHDPAFQNYQEFVEECMKSLDLEQAGES